MPAAEARQINKGFLPHGAKVQGLHEKSTRDVKTRRVEKEWKLPFGSHIYLAADSTP